MHEQPLPPEPHQEAVRYSVGRAAVTEVTEVDSGWSHQVGGPDFNARGGDTTRRETGETEPLTTRIPNSSPDQFDAEQQESVRWQAYPDMEKIDVPQSNGKAVTVRVGDKLDIPNEGGWLPASVRKFWFNSDGEVAVEMTWREEDGEHSKYVSLTGIAAYKSELLTGFAPPENK